jgi:leucyl/phenylalanyl-tRNA--protein transferase
MSDRQLTPELLLSAYASGIFPMAEGRESRDVFWVDPRSRGVLPLDGFHMSRSLSKRLRRGNYRIALSTDLDAVLDGCADRDETWINGTIRDLTRALFDAGHAHTLEVWRDGRVIGGVYGITLGGAFFGESMFSRETDASKIALAWLVDHLNRTGFTLFDTQFITPHLASLGAIEFPRATYRARLAEALLKPSSIKKFALETDPHAVVQRMTQTS